MKNLYIFALFSFLLPAGYAQLSIDLGPDSLHVCAGDPLLLQADIQGAALPYSIIWSDGSQGGIFSHMPLVGGLWVSATVTDGLGNTATDSVWIHGHNACVWPGDANGDAWANNMDILPLGQSIGLSGPARPDPHFNWIGQPADRWNLITGAGVDAVHSDTDGNGTVDAADIQGILLNYTSPQKNPGLSVSAGGGGVPLFVNFPSGNAGPGQIISADIILGSAQIPADSVYGLAFSIQYDATLFVPGSLIVQYDSSWLGTPGVDLISLDRDFPAASQVDIGISRTNQQMRAGFGKIATIIVTVDDIAGKNYGIEMVSFSISHVSLTNQDGDPLQVSPETSQVGIALSNEESLLPSGWNVYPSPAQDFLIVETDAFLSGRAELVLTDLQGRELIRQTVPGGTTARLETASLPRGFYLINLKTNNNMTARQKIILE